MFFVGYFYQLQKSDFFAKKMESHCTALLIQKSTDEAGRNVFHVAAAIDDYIYVKMVSDEGRKVVGLIETMFEATESENKLSPLQVGMVFFFFFFLKILNYELTL